MATKVKVKTQKKTLDKKTAVRRFVIIPAAVILVAAIVITAMMLRPGATATSTLKRFYTTLYTYSGTIDDLFDCLMESVHPEAEILYSTGGSSALGMYRADAEAKVGENVSVVLKVLDESSDSSTLLKQAQQVSPDATHAKTYRFSLTLKGDQGELEHIGLASLIKIGGKWYLTSPNPELAEREELENQVAGSGKTD